MNQAGLAVRPSLTASAVPSRSPPTRRPGLDRACHCSYIGNGHGNDRYRWLTPQTEAGAERTVGIALGSASTDSIGFGYPTLAGQLLIARVEAPAGLASEAAPGGVRARQQGAVSGTAIGGARPATPRLALVAAIASSSFLS